MRILITHCYSWKNKGDAAILISEIGLINRLFSNQDIEIDIMSYAPELDREYYLKLNNVREVYSNMINTYKLSKNKYINRLQRLFYLIVHFIKYKYFRKSLLKDFYSQRFQEADLIFPVGGGWLGNNAVLVNMVVLLQLYITTLYGKPVIMIGNSVQPSDSRFITKTLKQVLSKVDRIYLREELSYKYLCEHLGLDNCRQLNDLAFLLPCQEADVYIDKYISKNSKDANYIIGFTVRKWKPEIYEDYISSVAGAIEYFIEKHRALFVFIPQVNYLNDNDIEVAYAVRDKLKTVNQSKVVVIEEDIRPEMIKGLMAEFDCFLGTRMHSNIFSTSMGIPTVAIAYENKTIGIMSELNMSDYILDIETLKKEDIIDKLELCINNRENIKQELKSNIDKMKNNIIKTLEEDDILKSYYI